MRYKITLLFLIFNMCIFAQNTPQAPTIQVTGKAEHYVMPDLGSLSLHVSEKRMNFNESISALDKKTAAIKKQLSKLGFKKDVLKTKAFQIRKNTIYDRNKRRDSGYVASQNIIVEFKNNEDRISEILTEFAEASVGMQLSFSFKISDDLKNTTKDKLMTEAALDAKRKAKLLAHSLDKQLFEILSISYGNTSVTTNGPMVRSVMVNDENAKYTAPISGFTPEKIRLYEQVYVSWFLK